MSDAPHLQPVPPRGTPPGHRAEAERQRGLRLPVGAPPEPRWPSVFPTEQHDREQQQRARRLRAAARDEWRAVVPVLTRHGLLSEVDQALVRRHCVAVALEAEATRDICLQGAHQRTERGNAKNPAVTAAHQLRQQLVVTSRELGLSPAARDRLRGPEVEEDEAANALD